ncbi:MAG: radical SAM protein [Cyclobacteriaceae bacterium]|nr:radical SAM protein [Cyclobacteriaceae bacterium]
MQTVIEKEVCYGFYDRLTKEFPSQIIVDITEVCNLACIHCPHPEFKKSEHYNARYLEPELNAKLVDEVKIHGQGTTQYIRYSSEGEPLLHPNAYDMIEYAVRHSGTFVTLTTNGTIMNEKRIQKLLDTGLHMIDISIDAFTPETYTMIRKGNLNVTRANVLKLLDLVKISKSKTKIVVSYIEQSENCQETKDFEAFWNDHGADYVVIRQQHSGAGFVDNIANIMRKENTKKGRYPCLYPWERIVLNPRGNLAFCPADWTHGSTIADYRATTIENTWNGEFYKKLREAHLTNQFVNHKFCGQCPDWKATHWPDEGCSYANMIEEFKEDR